MEHAQRHHPGLSHCRCLLARVLPEQQLSFLLDQLLDRYLQVRSARVRPHARDLPREPEWWDDTLVVVWDVDTVGVTASPTSDIAPVLVRRILRRSIPVLALVAFPPAARAVRAQERGEVPAGCEIVAGTLRGSADGTRVAYVARRGDAFHPVVAHEPVAGKGFDLVEPPVFDPAGAHVLFRAMKRGRDAKETWHLLLDGKEVAKGGWIGPVAVSSAGTPAYWVFEDARQLGGCQFLFGKKKSSKWVTGALDGPPLFLPGGRALTIATRGGGWSLLTLDEKGKEEHRELAGLVSVVAAPTQAEVLCTVVRNVDAPPYQPLFYRVVRLGLPEDAPLGGLGDGYRSAGSPTYAAHGARVAFKVLGEAGMGVATADESAVATTPYAFVDELTFSPDGKRLAYVACREGTIELPETFHVPEGSGVAVLRGVRASGGHWSVVVDDESGGDWESAGRLVWAPDGSRVAFIALRSGAWRVVAGERESEPADEIAAPAWTANGARIRYACREGRTILWRELALE